MAYTDSQAFPVTGRALRLHGVIIDATTANPLTGGLTGLACLIRVDDGSFAPSANAPVEIGTSGYFDLDLTADELSGAVSCVVEVIATNAGAVYWSCEVALLPSDFVSDQAICRKFDTNLYTKVGDVMTLYDDDGTTPLYVHTYVETAEGFIRGQVVEQ